MGARNSRRTDLFYAQAKKDSNGIIIPNSAIEEMLLKDDIQDMGSTNRNLWLESCGHHAAMNADVARLKDPDKFERSFSKKYPGMRPPDIMSLWVNTPQNYPTLKTVRPDLDPHTINGSEVPQYHSFLLGHLFGHKAEFAWDTEWDLTVSLVRSGAALVKCLINPAHFIAVVDYDEQKKELVYLDSRAYIDDNWDSRLTELEYNSNTRKWGTICPAE